MSNVNVFVVFVVRLLSATPTATCASFFTEGTDCGAGFVVDDDASSDVCEGAEACTLAHHRHTCCKRKLLVACLLCCVSAVIRALCWCELYVNLTLCCCCVCRGVCVAVTCGSVVGECSDGFVEDASAKNARCHTDDCSSAEDHKTCCSRKCAPAHVCCVCTVLCQPLSWTFVSTHDTYSHL